MSKAIDVALVVVEGDQRRSVVASVTVDATVRDLAAALKVSSALYRHEQELAPDESLVEAGVLSGDELGIGTPVPVDWRQLGAELRVIGGDGAGLRSRIDGRGLIIGRGDDADVVLRGARLSRRHIEVALIDDGFRVRDLGSRNGVEVDGVVVSTASPVDVAFGAAVRIGDSIITVVPSADAGTTLRRADPFHLAFAGGRPHRVAERPAAATQVVAARPTPRRSIVPFVVPSAGAAALAATASGAPPAIAFAATPVALLAALGAERLLHRHQARKADRAASATEEERVAEHRAAVHAFARAARAAAPDPASLVAVIEHRGNRLWSESALNVRVRIGLCDEDGVLVPRTVGLSAAPVVVAGTAASLDALFAWLVVQFVALVPPRECDVVVVSDRVADWAWTAWLPHRSVATVLPGDAVPGDLPPRRAARRLVVLDRPRSPRWAGDPTLSIDDLILWRSEHEEDVPFNASAVLSAASATLVRLEDADGVRDDVVPDAIHDPVAFASRCALALSRLQSPFGTTASSGPVHLGDVLANLGSVDDLVAAWRHSGGPLRAVLGVDDLGLLEIVLDGQNSHALVAGTTGSGKTRLLETLVVSLAATRSPSDLNVLIIDFKGGNELASVAQLPHCVGLVSDREVAEVDRAISALTREIARRDDVFAGVGASEVNDYIAKTGQVLPRLVVIADEFGQFRREDSLGGRVATLLRIAAQGRSKGIHLVLATQSPSTDVTAEIRQNIGVRLCLRVAEAAESIAVLGVPDAARLAGPGHVLVASDNDLRSGRVATAQLPVADVPPVRVTELVASALGRAQSTTAPTDRLLDEVVERMRLAAQALGATAPVLLAPALPTSVERRALAHADRKWTTGGLVVGARDRPGIAEPPPFAFDVARDASLLIVGGPRSGRTTTLLALAEAARDQVDPDAPLVVHAIAWANGLEAIEGAKGDGGVVRRGDFDHLRRTLAWLSSEPPNDGVTRLLLIDRLDVLLREIRELDAGGLAAQLLDVIQDGPRRGLAVAATLEPSALLAGAATALGGPRLILPIDDPTLAAAAGVVHRAGAQPGRAIAPNGDDVQIGLPRGAVPEATPVDGHVERMPKVVALESLAPASGERVVIGVGGAALLAPMEVDLEAAGPVIVVIGRAGSGRSAALAAFGAGYHGGRNVVRDPDSLPESPSLLLIDDAARSASLRPWIEADDFPDVLRRGGHIAVLAFEQADLTTLGYRHWLSRRTYPGLLLSLDATPDRIVAGERLGFLPPAELRVGPAGRGWWCWRGAGVPVQVAAI